jgi:transcriptional regulator with XRE-family HTH domain
MPLRTRAVEIALERGWTLADLAKRAELSPRVIYYLRDGRSPSSSTIEAIRRVFPELAFDDLFVSDDCTSGHDESTLVQEPAAA